MSARDRHDTSRKQTVGVVLASGGIKTFAAIPLFEFLHENNITLDLAVGCSGGGLMAALIGAGFTPDKIRRMIDPLLDKSLFAKVDLRTLLGILKLPYGRFDASSGLLKPDAIQAVYGTIFGDLRLEDLSPQTLLHTTDMLTGEGVVLSSGPVADAVYATGAAYPVLPPINIEGRWLVDGVFSSSLPLMEAVNRNIDIIITMTVSSKLTEAPEGFLDNYSYFNEMTKTAYERSQIPLAVDMHHNEIVFINVTFDRVIDMWHVDQIPTVLEAGRKAVDKCKDEIICALQKTSDTSPIS